MSYDLEAPTLLLAMPQVLDPFFHRSIVLLMAHGDEGSIGLVVNRPTNLLVQDVLEDMEISWRGDPAVAAFVGGPVRPRIGSVLYTCEDQGREKAGSSSIGTQVLPGLSLTQEVKELEKLAQTPPAGLRLLLGYAGWSPGQLLEEVLRNDWLTAPIDLGVVFHDDPVAAWETGLRSVGVDPATLPSWTDPSDLAN